MCTGLTDAVAFKISTQLKGTPDILLHDFFCVKLPAGRFKLAHAKSMADPKSQTGQWTGPNLYQLHTLEIH